MSASRTSLARLFTLALAVVAVSACATSGGGGGGSEPEPDAETGVIPRDRVYDLSFDSVWAGVLAAYRDMDVEIETVALQEGRVRGKRSRLPTHLGVENYMQCGSQGVLGDWTNQPNFKAEYSLSALVAELEDGGVDVKIRASFFGQVGHDRMGCGSTGRFEHEFFETLDAGLNAEPRESESS